MRKQEVAIKIGKAKVFRNGNRKNKNPKIFLSLRVFLPSFFTTTQLAAFSLRAESSPFPPCRKERKPIKEKTTKKN